MNIVLGWKRQQMHTESCSADILKTVHLEDHQGQRVGFRETCCEDGKSMELLG
jgi:hypothetical protein